MRYAVTALALSLLAVPAAADPISDRLFGRPNSIGVSRESAFGATGADYFGEMRMRDPYQAEAVPRQSEARPHHRHSNSGATAAHGPQAIVARPYQRY